MKTRKNWSGHPYEGNTIIYHYRTRQAGCYRHIKIDDKVLFACTHAEICFLGLLYCKAVQKRKHGLREPH